MTIPLAVHARAASWLGFLWQPFRLALAAALVVALYALALPNHYTSVVNILPVETKGLGGGLSSLAAAATAIGMGLPGQDGSDTTYVDILNSRWMRENLLRTTYSFKVRTWGFGAPQARTQTLYDYLHRANLDRAVQEMGLVLSANRDVKTRILTVEVDTKSPELSQQIAEQAVGLLETFVQKTGQTRGGYKAAFAEARLLEARQEMAGLEDKLRAFLEVNRNYSVSSDPTVRLRGMRLENDLKLYQQLVTTLAVNREQALMEEKNDLPILNVLDKANLPLEKSYPARAAMILKAFFAVGFLALGWLNREWLKTRFTASDEDPEPSRSPSSREQA